MPERIDEGTFTPTRQMTAHITPVHVQLDVPSRETWPQSRPRAEYDVTTPNVLIGEGVAKGSRGVRGCESIVNFE